MTAGFVGVAILLSAGLASGEPEAVRDRAQRRAASRPSAEEAPAKRKPLLPRLAWKACTVRPHERDGYPVARYRAGDEIPPCYTVESRTRQGAWVTGAALATVGELFLIMAASEYGFEHGSAWYMVPVLGPLLPSKSQRDAMAEDPRGGAGLLLGLGPLMQVAGGVLIMVGVLAKRDMLVPVTTDVSVLPMTTPGNYGLVGVGRF